MHEQMHALQRKLVNVVTENEAMRHVVDQLQCHVLGLRRQLQLAGLKPTMQLDEELLRPCPHKVTGLKLLGRSSIAPALVLQSCSCCTPTTTQQPRDPCACAPRAAAGGAHNWAAALQELC